MILTYNYYNGRRRYLDGGSLIKISTECAVQINNTTDKTKLHQ